MIWYQMAVVVEEVRHDECWELGDVGFLKITWFDDRHLLSRLWNSQILLQVSAWVLRGEGEVDNDLPADRWCWVVTTDSEFWFWLAFCMGLAYWYNWRSIIVKLYRFPYNQRARVLVDGHCGRKVLLRQGVPPKRCALIHFFHPLHQRHCCRVTWRCPRCALYRRLGALEQWRACNNSNSQNATCPG